MANHMGNTDKPKGGHLPLWRRAFLPAVLFVLVVALYAPSMSNDFLYDDNELILQQVTPRSVGDMVKLFTERHWHNLPYYRPVAWFTMVGQKFLHGNHAGPYHLFNAMLMGCAAMLAYALLRLPVLAVRPLPAAMGAALFAVHPIASLCVYPIAARETLMAVIFIIAAVYAFMRAGRHWYILAMLMFALSLLCKELAVIVPGLFVLTDVTGLSAVAPGRFLRRWIPRYAPVALVLLLYFLIRWHLFGAAAEHHLAVFEQPSGPLLSLLYTLQTMFVPFVQLVYEPHLEVWMSPWRLLVSQLVLVLLAVGIYRHWSAMRIVVLFWLGWFFLALFPTANVMTQEARFAERYGFLALLGVIGIFGSLASSAWDRPAARRVMTGIGITLLVVCAAISFNRSKYFQNEFTFHSQWVHTNPQLGKAYNYLGATLAAQGNIDEAITHYYEALRINPDSVMAHNNMGIALARLGKTAEAVSHYSEALRIKPDHEKAHNNLGIALVDQGKPDEAIEHYSEALRINPGYEQAHINMANALVALDKLDEAIRHYSRALQINPDSVKAHINLGDARVDQGKVAEAMGHYSEALRINPNHERAHFNLGAALAKLGKTAEAISHYSEALRIKPDNAEVHNNMGNALARLGKLKEAIRHYSEALRIKTDYAEAHNNLGVALARHGSLKKAVSHFSEALRIKPDFAGARKNLERGLRLIDKSTGASN
jgi:tetratricopeptide (TPR) repeat protein